MFLPEKLPIAVSDFFCYDLFSFVENCRFMPLLGLLQDDLNILACVFIGRTSEDECYSIF